MRSRHTLILGGALLLLGLATFSGCATAPVTAPPPAPAPAEPEFVRVEAVAVDTAGQPIPVQASTVLGKIDGGKGGSLHNGRFDLEVPPGAWEGEMTVTLTVPDPALMQCQISIDKPEANQFKVPVMLYGHCDNAVSVDSSEEMIFVCQDDLTGEWKEVQGSTSSTATATVSAALPHFSNYGVVGGKAGW
jgi:hypothetical protein